MEISTTPATENNINLDFTTLNKASKLLKSINHKLRKQMMQLISTNGKLTVTEIQQMLSLNASTASQHLAILRKAGFVDTAREGKNVFYLHNKKNTDYLNYVLTRLLEPSL